MPWLGSKPRAAECHPPCRPTRPQFESPANRRHGRDGLAPARQVEIELTSEAEIAPTREAKIAPTREAEIAPDGTRELPAFAARIALQQEAPWNA
jgi:hypothetical protein